MTGEGSDSARGNGRFSIVGIGPGLPDHLTQAARSTIQGADTVYAAPLYQSFLRADGLIATEDASEDRVIDSARGDQAELARDSFCRVREGEDVVHVSGGDPNVYGKSDLLLAIAEAEGIDDIEIEVIPGVTAALGAAAALGAPLGDDFATVSLSDSWRNWDEIEQRLRGATEAGFVLALYNGWRDLDRAVSVIRENRDDDVPVAIVEDIARGESGRNPTGESTTLSTLGAVVDDWEGASTPGLLAIVGNRATRIVRFGDDRMLVTPRGEFNVEAI